MFDCTTGQLVSLESPAEGTPSQLESAPADAVMQLMQNREYLVLFAVEFYHTIGGAQCIQCPQLP